MPNLSFLKNSSGTILLIAGYCKGICLKVNVIARLEFKLAYYDSAVQRFNYTPRRHPFPVVV